MILKKLRGHGHLSEEDVRGHGAFLVKSALIRIPAAGTQRLDWMRVAERSPAVRAAFIFAAAVAVERAAIAAFV